MWSRSRAISANERRLSVCHKPKPIQLYNHPSWISLFYGLNNNVYCLMIFHCVSLSKTELFLVLEHELHVWAVSESKEDNAVQPIYVHFSLPVDFSIQVLSSGSWPFQQSCTFALPSEVRCCSLFNRAMRLLNKSKAVVCACFVVCQRTGRFFFV